jgi:thymidine phosphorylase
MDPSAETKSSPAPLGTALEAPTSNGLLLKRVAIDTHHENVAYLHRDCEVYRAEDFQALSKVQVHANGNSNGNGNGNSILATLNVVDDTSIVGCGEIGLSEDAFVQLAVPHGRAATVSQAEPPASIPALFRKIDGERLGRADFAAIVRDIAEYRHSKIELTAFVVACNRSELDREEVCFLT